MSRKPNLKLVKQSPNGNHPPRPLGKHGQSLWNRVTSEYDISDAAGREILVCAAQALDRAEALRSQIDRDGELLVLRNGNMKEHPGIKPELANRAFVVRALIRLGLDVEPMRDRVGRPGGANRGFGWQPDGGEE